MGHGPVINAELCTGCNLCVEACSMGVLYSAEKKGEPPLVSYPDECWYGGGCYMVCPTQPPAITLVHPPNLRLRVKRVK
jgi:adenylylsulfate reductase subunit B